MKKILILALVIMSAKMLYADEYIYDTIWNRQIPGGYQQLSADRQKVYALNTKLYSLDIKTGQIDTLTQDYTVRFSLNLQTYISYNDGKYFARRIQGNEIIKELGEFILNSTYSSNGDYLITFSSNQTNTAHSFKVFDTQTYEMVFTDYFSEEASINASDITFSPNGKKFMIKSTAPNKPNTQLKFHIYELETWKKYEYLGGGIDKGYLRDDEILFAPFQLIDYKLGKITEDIPSNYKAANERFVMCKVSNSDIYFVTSTNDLQLYYLDKYNFETKKSIRYNFTKDINITKIVTLFKDTILGTGRNLLTNELSWFLLYPKIIAGVTEQNKFDLKINIIDKKLIITNPQNHQINILTAYDILGRTYPLSANGNEVDVSALATGRYFLKVGLADGSFLDFGFVVE